MKNNWTKNNKEQINFYLNSNEIILVERKRSIQILKDIIRYNFREQKNLNILDFGCGNGIITKELYQEYPDNNYFLLDGSDIMLEKAKETLANIKINTIKTCFEEYLEKELEEEKYDIIFSSMAIHHLDFVNKSKLFSKFYHELKFGGLFINIDVIHPPTEKLEKWQFQMWRDWMNETLITNGFEAELGKHDKLPEIYKYKSENKPSDLFLQLEEMKKAGFRNVDVFYKYGIFSVYGGTKE